MSGDDENWVNRVGIEKLRGAMSRPSYYDDDVGDWDLKYMQRDAEKDFEDLERHIALADLMGGVEGEYSALRKYYEEYVRRNMKMEMSNLGKEWVQIHDRIYSPADTHYTADLEILEVEKVSYDAIITIKAAVIQDWMKIPYGWKRLTDDRTGEKYYPDGYGKIEYTVNDLPPKVGYVRYRDGRLEASTINFETLGLSREAVKAFDGVPYKNSNAAVKRIVYDQMYDRLMDSDFILEEYAWKMRGVDDAQAMLRFLAGSYRGMKIKRIGTGFSGAFENESDYSPVIGMADSDPNSQIVEIKIPESQNWQKVSRSTGIYYLLSLVEPRDLEKDLYDILKDKFEFYHGAEPPKRPAPGIRFPSSMIQPPIKDIRPLESSRPPKANPPRVVAADSDVVFSDDDDDSDASSAGSESPGDELRETPVNAEGFVDVEKIERAIDEAMSEAELHKFKYGDKTVKIHASWNKLEGIAESQIRDGMIVFPKIIPGLQIQKIHWVNNLTPTDRRDLEIDYGSRGVTLPADPATIPRKASVTGYKMSVISDLGEAFSLGTMSRLEALEFAEGSARKKTPGHVVVWKNTAGELLIPDGYAKIMFDDVALRDIYARFSHGNIIVTSELPRGGRRGLVASSEYVDDTQPRRAYDFVNDSKGNSVLWIEIVLGDAYKTMLRDRFPQIRAMKRAKPKTRRIPTLSRHRGKHGRSGRDYDNDD